MYDSSDVIDTSQWSYWNESEYLEALDNADILSIQANRDSTDPSWRRTTGSIIGSRVSEDW